MFYLDLLWGRVDSLSSSVGHSGGQTSLANGHTMDAEHGRVVIQSLIQGPAIKGRAGTPPKPAGLQNAPTLLPKEAPRTHTKVTIWEAVRSCRSMKAKYLARNGFLLKSSTRTWAVTAFPISTWQGMGGRGCTGSSEYAPKFSTTRLVTRLSEKGSPTAPSPSQDWKQG